MIEDFYVPEDLAEAKRLADLLTTARTRALIVLRDNGPARYSNHTGHAGPSVYWQSANWLSHRGLVAITDVDRRRKAQRHAADGMVVTITDLGRWVLARRLEG